MNADRVKRKLPSLLVDDNTTKKKSWNNLMRYRYRLTQFKKRQPEKFNSITNRILLDLADSEKAVNNSGNETKRSATRRGTSLGKVALRGNLQIVGPGYDGCNTTLAVSSGAAIATLTVSHDKTESCCAGIWHRGSRTSAVRKGRMSRYPRCNGGLVEKAHKAKAF